MQMINIFYERRSEKGISNEALASNMGVDVKDALFFEEQLHNKVQDLSHLLHYFKSENIQPYMSSAALSKDDIVTIISEYHPVNIKLNSDTLTMDYKDPIKQHINRLNIYPSLYNELRHLDIHTIEQLLNISEDIVLQNKEILSDSRIEEYVQYVTYWNNNYNLAITDYPLFRLSKRRLLHIRAANSSQPLTLSSLMVYPKIQNVFRHIRVAKNITLQELGDKIGVSYSAVTSREHKANHLIYDLNNVKLFLVHERTQGFMTLYNISENQLLNVISRVCGVEISADDSNRYAIKALPLLDLGIEFLNLDNTTYSYFLRAEIFTIGQALSHSPSTIYNRLETIGTTHTQDRIDTLVDHLSEWLHENNLDASLYPLFSEECTNKENNVSFTPNPNAVFEEHIFNPFVKMINDNPFTIKPSHEQYINNIVNAVLSEIKPLTHNTNVENIVYDMMLSKEYVLFINHFNLSRTSFIYLVEQCIGHRLNKDDYGKLILNKEAIVEKDIPVYIPSIEESIRNVQPSVRAYTICRRHGIDTIEDLLQTSYEDMLSLRNMGPKLLNQLEQNVYDWSRENNISVLEYPLFKEPE